MCDVHVFQMRMLGIVGVMHQMWRHWRVGGHHVWVQHHHVVRVVRWGRIGCGGSAPPRGWCRGPVHRVRRRRWVGVHHLMVVMMMIGHNGGTGPATIHTGIVRVRRAGRGLFVLGGRRHAYWRARTHSNDRSEGFTVSVNRSRQQLQVDEGPTRDDDSLPVERKNGTPEDTDAAFLLCVFQIVAREDQRVSPIVDTFWLVVAQPSLMPFGLFSRAVDHSRSHAGAQSNRHTMPGVPESRTESRAGSGCCRSTTHSGRLPWTGWRAEGVVRSLGRPAPMARPPPPRNAHRTPTHVARRFRSVRGSRRCGLRIPSQVGTVHTCRMLGRLGWIQSLSRA